LSSPPKSKNESSAHSSRTLLRGGHQIPAKKSRGKANPFPPAKIVLLCLVHIAFRAATLPEYLEGRTSKENTLSFFRKDPVRAKSEK